MAYWVEIRFYLVNFAESEEMNRIYSSIQISLYFVFIL